MDAVDFLTAFKRICATSECGLCPCFNDICGTKYDLRKTVYAQKAVATVEEWAKRHPVKTRQSAFLEKFPNAATYRGFIQICPSLIDGTIDDIRNCDPRKDCQRCMEAYWTETI